MLVTQEFNIVIDGYYPILNDMHLEFGPGVHIMVWVKVHLLMLLWALQH